MSLLIVYDIGKAFRHYSSEWKRVARLIGLPFKPIEEHWVLRNINFEIQPGETVGIVGQNGAGKSTLLKMITGVLQPTEGAIHINGRVAAILELGMGFSPELTGRQNAFHFAGLMGFSADQIQQVMPEIESFAEIGEYFDQPIRTYSSGMQMRMAFSVATIYKPDILIIDEALAVGDAYFQQKCMKKIFDLKTSGVSILFVSHDMNSVKMLCDSTVLIDDGKMIDHGDPKDVINFYQNMILKKSHRGDVEFKHKEIKEKNIKKISTMQNHASTGEVELVEVTVMDDNNQEVNYIVSEKILIIGFKIKSMKYLEDPHYGIILRNKFGISVFETNTYTMRLKTQPQKKGATILVEFKFECNLSAGDYSLSIGVGNKGFDRGSFEEYLLFVQDIEMIKVIENSESICYSGCTNLKPSVTFQI